MAYTAKKLADLSGISVRTLHWYDEQGLLKPAYYGEENNYRYYEKEQLLALQQILFFRELGFKLDAIKEVINAKEFDRISALQEHERKLKKQIERTNQLICTIQETIKDLKGEQSMEDTSIYKGFQDWIGGAGKDTYHLVKKDEVTKDLEEAQEIVLQSTRQDKSKADWTKDDWQAFNDKANGFLSDVSKLLQAGDKPESKAVQAVLKGHYEHAKEFHYMSPVVYLAMADLYRAHPVYRKQLDPHHKDLAEFMAKAMEYFASQKKF
ncbi:MAG: MerR family transcriptional regulator [Deltaproteobacteria bacterium]|nr:MerR family transcriptional regulator [Deltaproteobacteria bacterium]